MEGQADRLDDLSKKIIGCAYAVSNTLGSGFLEKVYENALAYELRRSGLEVKQQQRILVWYEDIVVGDYVADLVVEQQILVEIKAVRAFEFIHLAQCLNYLKATGISVCLLLNFGTSRVTLKRIVHRF